MMNSDNRNNSRKKRINPKELAKLLAIEGRTFGELSRYDLLLAGRICANDIKAIYDMSDEEFNKWIVLGPASPSAMP